MLARIQTEAAESAVEPVKETEQDVYNGLQQAVARNYRWQFYSAP